MSEISIVILTALKIVFMYGAMQKDEVLWKLRQLLEWLTDLLPARVRFYARKPLFDCVFCMSSIWGLFFIFITLPLWLDVILSIAGLNYLVSAYIGYFHAAKDEAEDNIEGSDDSNIDLKELLTEDLEYADDYLTFRHNNSLDNKVRGIIIGWDKWSDICEIIPKENFAGGVYLDNYLQPCEYHTNRLGVKLKNSNYSFLAEGDFVGVNVFGKFTILKEDELINNWKLV